MRIKELEHVLVLVDAMPEEHQRVCAKVLLQYVDGLKGVDVRVLACEQRRERLEAEIRKLSHVWGQRKSDHF